MHFWGLSRFNQLVFDEIYYAKFSYSYFINGEYFDVHPPLGKYMIAIGMQIYHWLSGNPLVKEATTNIDTVTGLSANAYRLMNAAIGTVLPLCVGLLGFLLTRRFSFGVIATILTLCDGFLLVESRYSLINIYLVFFGVLALIAFVQALTTRRWRIPWLILAGVFFGATTSVKWNGLGFLLTAYLFYGGSKLLLWLAPNVVRSPALVSRSNNGQPDFSATDPHDRPSSDPKASDSDPSPIQPLNQPFDHDPNQSATPTAEPAPHQPQLIRGAAQISLPLFGLTQAIVPAIIYYLLWIPHLRFNPKYDFWEMQHQIISFHSNAGGNTTETHPYCSRWYTWPLMERPIGYYFQQYPQNGITWVQDVHAFGTPILWWLSSLAIIGTAIVVFIWLAHSLRYGRVSKLHLISSVNLVSPLNLSVGCFVVAGYLANFLPWAKVSRCTFMYHYMSAEIFTFLALAWILDRVWQRKELMLRAITPTLILACIVAFWFWMPIFYGTTITRAAFDLRMWSQSWY